MLCISDVFFVCLSLPGISIVVVTLAQVALAVSACPYSLSYDCYSRSSAKILPHSRVAQLLGFLLEIAFGCTWAAGLTMTGLKL